MTGTKKQDERGGQLWESLLRTSNSHASDNRKPIAFIFLVRTQHIPLEEVPVETMAMVSKEHVVNYTEKNLHIYIFFSFKIQEKDVKEECMSGHDLQILYTSHFHHNSELRFCRKYFGLQTTYISDLNVLSFQETVFGRVLSFMLHTLTLSTQTYNQIDKSPVSIYVPKLSSNILISIFFAGGEVL